MTNMGELPERQRRALVLRELEGRSYDEIATTLGVTGDGVRQLLNRARNSMRAAASALVPPALVGRIAGSQASVRIAELMDPPSSALMAKATAAVAAGAVALFAVTGPPSGDGGKVPRAEAAQRAPATAQDRDEAGARSVTGAPSADPTSSDTSEPGKAGPRSDGRGHTQARAKNGAGRAAAGPGAGSGGGDDDGPARARVAPPAGGDDDDDGPATRRGGGDDDDDAPAAGQRGGSDDDDGAPAPGAPAGGDDGGDDGTVAAATPPPPDDGGDAEAEAPAPPPSPTPPAPQPQATLADDDDGGETHD
jgi:hypothetical protein